jgi:hypothetical protein
MMWSYQGKMPWRGMGWFHFPDQPTSPEIHATDKPCCTRFCWPAQCNPGSDPDVRRGWRWHRLAAQPCLECTNRMQV